MAAPFCRAWIAAALLVAVPAGPLSASPVTVAAVFEIPTNQAPTRWFAIMSNGDVLNATAPGLCSSQGVAWNWASNIYLETGLPLAGPPFVGAVVDGQAHPLAVNSEGVLFQGNCDGGCWHQSINFFVEAGRPQGEVVALWGAAGGPSRTLNILTSAGEVISKTAYCPAHSLGVIPYEPTVSKSTSWGQIKTLYR